MEIVTSILAISLMIIGIFMWVKGEGKRKGIGIGIVMALLITGFPEFADSFYTGFMEGWNEAELERQ
ncbi:hypothetical protein [Priestia taiwanensis]|uniref:Uncharacterized protein n=1 Tax=Priestia taiwanensis TaxID=1347902 RepID=A0A917ASC2_9BACI|nr:hypothetical protein [Priestia taiwanensis]MBM7363942.1 multisubunit Na+/H+ antiporter MnhC subunit [Priestia taiwanensis]GGE70348.1 hypothetical protein GCM10007140_20330 [Priestia taiwanensis]